MPRPRFDWGLFAGTKADLVAPGEVQPVARQMNRHAGLNLTKLAAMPAETLEELWLACPDRPFYEAALKRAVDELMAELEQAFPGLPNARWVALRLLDGVARMMEAVRTRELDSLVSQAQGAPPPPEPGIGGGGTVHHVAWSSAIDDH